MIEAWHKYVSYIKWVVTCGALRKMKELRARSSSQRKAFRFVRFMHTFEERRSAERYSRLSLQIGFKAILFHCHTGTAREQAEADSANCSLAFDKALRLSNSRAMGLYKLETVFSRTQQKRAYFRWWKSSSMWTTLLEKVTASYE